MVMFICIMNGTLIAEKEFSSFCFMYKNFLRHGFISFINTFSIASKYYTKHCKKPWITLDQSWKRTREREKWNDEDQLNLISISYMVS